MRGMVRDYACKEDSLQWPERAIGSCFILASSVPPTMGKRRVNGKGGRSRMDQRSHTRVGAGPGGTPEKWPERAIAQKWRNWQILVNHQPAR